MEDYIRHTPNLPSRCLPRGRNEGNNNPYNSRTVLPPPNYPRTATGNKRYAMNIPSNRPNPDERTGIRAKILLPSLNRNQYADDDYGEHEDGDQLNYQTQSTCNMMTEEDMVNKLEQLINEENEEIEKSNMYLQHSQAAEYNIPKTFQGLVERHRQRYTTHETVLDSELQPEIAAALLTSEQRGETLKHTPPAALYGRLFPEDVNMPRIQITAASKKDRNVAVPIRQGLHPKQLTDDLDAGIVDYYELAPAKKDEQVPKAISYEANDDPDQILGVADNAVNTDEMSRLPFKHNVNNESPQYGNYVQLRGSEPPCWFAGYFTITPGMSELVPLDEPNEALEKAWNSMGPTQVASYYGNILLGDPNVTLHPCAYSENDPANCEN